jgi:predicted transcriptional regulator of viral defense system
MDNQNAKVRVGRVAGRQWGRVSWRQLERLGVDRATVSDWVRQGYLHRHHPGVYAVGHTAPTIEGELAAALLYAGPGAMLSHATAAWWLALTDRRPATIHVSTPRRCRSLNGVRVYGRRSIDRIWHGRLPVTPAPQTLLDYATSAPRNRLRRALAEADYQRLLDLPAFDRILGRGRPGAAKLRRALEQHQPKLALTRSPLEEAFLALCETYEIPLPDVNVTLEGFLVDAVWRQERVIVELDGDQAHGTAAQRNRDHRRDLVLRRAGFLVLRYTWDQVTREPWLVAADVRARLAERTALSPSAPSASPGSR